ncbi:reverse transcriptase [Gossypium australe]|uniref:Reverse transcriptase n=1 Tax=Gossypium australe TaxID=47621 RepID=A0A5B6VVJ5_9ROSI|nr:reverse transcriptase [Gossypium australe]
MPTKLPKKLPPKREVDYKIELVPNMESPTRAPYCMSLQELNELQKIWDSSGHLNLHLVASVVPKEARWVVEDLGSVRWFIKLDLRSRYHKVRIAEGDEPKKTCVTRYGLYEFLLMPFGLTNVLATFYTLMNKVLQPFLDRFVVVYLNDVVVYSKSLEEHVGHLMEVIQTLRENELYVPFLGHVVGGSKIWMDERKFGPFFYWEPPTKVTKLRLFLGLANYY